MELAVFTSIVGVIKELLGLADAFSQADERKRERVAAWLQQLGELIQDIADKIELNDYPHNTCAQMEIMVDHFPLIVDGLIDSQKVDMVHDILKNSAKIEALFGEAQHVDKETRDDMINSLLRASGKLQGLASVIKHLD
jgi:hypothetical protein